MSWNAQVRAALTRQGGHVRLTDATYRESARQRGESVGTAKPLAFQESIRLREREGTKLTPAQSATAMLRTYGFDRNGNKILPKAPKAPPAPKGARARSEAKPRQTPKAPSVPTVRTTEDAAQLAAFMAATHRDNARLRSDSLSRARELQSDRNTE